MERSKRNKSRQTNKPRLNINTSENGGNNQSTSMITDLEQIGFQSQSQQQQSQQQQQSSGGLIRSKPCREIYRPPNCRRGRNSNQSNSGHYQNQNYYSYNNNNNTEQLYNNNGNSYDVQQIVKSSSVPNSPSIKINEVFSCQEQQMTSSSIGQGYRPLNIHAKEFHFKPISDDIESQVNKSPYYGIVSTTTANDKTRSNEQNQSGTNFYSLCQSKSSGNITTTSLTNNNNNQTKNGQSNQIVHGNQFSGITTNTSQVQYYNNCDSDRNNSRLQQSKSSGNIPGKNNKVVRFVEDGNQNSMGEHGTFDMLLHSTKSLRIGGENTSSSMPGIEPPLAMSQPRMPFLQKSRTTIHMGMGSHNMNNQMNQFSNYVYRNFPQRQPPPVSSFLPFQGLIPSPNVLPSPILPGPGQLKRSKSFTVKSQIQNKSSGNFGLGITAETPCSISPNFGDFCINKWPKAIQDSITSAVTGGDRTPPRHRINMVTSIFDTLLDTSNSVTNTSNSKDSNESNESSVDKLNESLVEQSGQIGQTELILPTVQIFLYFIQREKDHTVMESLLNTCYSIFQSLSIAHGLIQGPGPDSGNKMANLKNKWNIFLSFLCSLYCQVKITKIQQQYLGNLVEQISMTVLTLLCDSCLATLRSLPICHSPETMDCLFTVMTSIGRDMEKTFPLKMKQILTSVRDALLGLGLYSTLAEAPPVVQKTLMQLIELHAANWHLPASAVRYYYSNPTLANNSCKSEKQTQNP